jgi:hypothetical protein
MQVYIWMVPGFNCLAAELVSIKENLQKEKPGGKL